MLIFIVESARENFDHKKYPKQLEAIDGVLRELRRDVIDWDELKKARHAAAAADAAYAAYAADARKKSYVKFADKLLELIKKHK